MAYLRILLHIRLSRGMHHLCSFVDATSSFNQIEVLRRWCEDEIIKSFRSSISEVCRAFPAGLSPEVPEDAIPGGRLRNQALLGQLQASVSPNVLQLSHRGPQFA